MKKRFEDISHYNIETHDLNGKQLFTLFVYINKDKANQYLIDNNIEDISVIENLSSSNPSWIQMYNTIRKSLNGKKVKRTVLWKIYNGDISLKEI